MMLNMGPWNLNGNTSSFQEGFYCPAPTMTQEFHVRVAMQTCFNAQVHTALVSLPPVSDAQRLCCGWFCSATHSLTHFADSRQQSVLARRHVAGVRDDILYFFLTVNVPAEEVMLHQHVLHSFLQRFLLLLLQKGQFEKKNRLILTRVNCGACGNGPRPCHTAQTWAIYCHKALIDGD